MGDRIKFGPEWLRNFSREGSAGSNNSQNAGGGGGGINTGPGNNPNNNASSGGGAREHGAHGLNNVNNAQGNAPGNFSYSALVANSHQYVGGGHAGGPNSYSALVAGNSSNNSYGSGNHGSNSYSASTANSTNSSYGGAGHGNASNPYNASVTTSTSNAYGGGNHGGGSYSATVASSTNNPYGGGGQNTYNATANTNLGGGTSSAFPGGNHGGPPSSSSANNAANANASNKVHLANLRYGREEMLALYDDDEIEPPEELRQFTLLYNTRKKPPIALSNHFEEDANRENARPVQTQNTPSPSERFPAGRGGGVSGMRGRGTPFNSVRSNTGRTTFRSTAVRPAYPERPAEDVYDLTSPPYRPWNSTSTNRSTSPNRNGMEAQPATAEWTPKRRWVPSSTNWRREPKREEGEEWRSSESARPRQMQPQEKWDRERGERPERLERTERGGRERSEKGQWGGRRAWGGEAQIGDENYPEWAMDNSETCGGVFDSSGAFHGYSNDDSNLPKTTAETNPLTRSHTQGSFSRSKVSDEGSEEWWASEKAKKLSPKRFEATQPPPQTSEPSSGTSQSTPNTPVATPSASFHTTTQPSFPLDGWGMMNKMTANAPKENLPATSEIDRSRKIQQQAKQIGEKTFDALMRSDINVEEASDERGNFQSVMIASNNSLRQRHQNIVSTASEVNAGQNPSVSSSLMCDAESQESPGNNSDMITMEYYDARDTLDPAPMTRIMSHNVAVRQQAMPNLGMRMAIPSPQNVLVMNRARFNVVNNPQVAPVTSMPRMSTVMSTSQVPMSRYASPTMVNVQRESLFLSEDNPAMPHQMGQANQMGGPSQAQQQNIFPLHGHGLGQDQATGPPYSSSLYNMMPPPPMKPQGADEWYYEDPEKIIQGPFSSKEMYGWFQAGFFTSTLMVRRACDSHMRPLGSFGPVVPFADDAIPFPPQGPRDSSSLGGTQQSLLGDVLMTNRRDAGMDALELEFGSFGNEFLAPAFSQLSIDSLWSSPSSHTNEIWNRDAANPAQDERKEIEDLWELAKKKNEMGIPADIKKEMKTEEQILAQIRATQKMQQNLQYISKEQQGLQAAALGKKDDVHTQSRLVIPDLGELERLMQKESLNAAASTDKIDSQITTQDKSKDSNRENNGSAKQAQSVTKADKSKPLKIEDKSKQAQNVPAKSKKKAKDEKKDDSSDSKEDKNEKRSQESSPSKSKKEDKLSKKEIEKEKKEWIKEGFTIVKGAEKSSSKDGKKKNEETKAAEEAERKRKEEEKITAEEEKRRRSADALKKQQEQEQQQQQARQLEAVTKKAPWSAVANQTQAINRDGLTLAEIQRLEREKKLEQMKEQQAMMQIIAQQQQAALAREQEMQAGLGWAKKKAANMNMPGQSLAEIQAEARKQAAAAAAVAAAAAAQTIEEVQPAQQPANIMPWGNPMNGGGFWDTERLNQINQKQTVEKSQEVQKSQEPKPKKKQIVLPKKELTPAVEFESWCTNILNQWSSKVDVPAFVGFLKDIESPYEIKEYVKCYLGESKDSNDFARQFLERRSKLLRAGTVTPVDDLCSPAAAINPRTISGSDYQEVKGKGKKSKKNKMLKVDARILGFSVTASEDRINVGDIDTV